MMITRGGAVQFSKTVVTLVKAVESQKTMKKKSNFMLKTPYHTQDTIIILFGSEGDIDKLCQMLGSPPFWKIALHHPWLSSYD